MAKNSILIVGKFPPPIGGVTIHVGRLITSLKGSSVKFDFSVLNLTFLLKFVLIVPKYNCIHIHSSSPIIRFYLVVLSRIFRTQSMVTIHGNIGRYKSSLKNWLDQITIKLATKPIVLNTGSLRKAKYWNDQTEMISAFIPPQMEQEYLALHDEEMILKMKLQYQAVFCTNAYNMTFDKNNVEIYGIFELIEAVSSRQDYALVISDPSEAYGKYLEEKGVILSPNIYFVKGNHSFFKVMDLCDGSIRNTSTDGDSLSVKESLYLHKPTFVTNAVERPPNCILFERGTFGTVLENMDLAKSENVQDVSQLNGFIRLEELYKIYTVVNQ